jgi:hypothetical protein
MSEKKLRTLRFHDLTFNRDLAKARIRRLRSEAHERLEATRVSDPTVLDALVLCRKLLEIGIEQDKMWPDIVELSHLEN